MNKNNIIHFLLNITSLSLILAITAHIFSGFNINLNKLGLYCFLASLIIFTLNKTIKPILIFLTLPLTIVTYGIFYPIINVVILYITSIILGNNFNVSGFISPFFASIFISITNILIEEIIINQTLKRLS